MAVIRLVHHEHQNSWFAAAVAITKVETRSRFFTDFYIVIYLGEVPEHVSQADCIVAHNMNFDHKIQSISKGYHYDKADLIPIKGMDEAELIQIDTNAIE